jgi:GTP cyclohydrolase II
MNLPAANFEPLFGMTNALAKLERAAFSLRRGDTVLVKSQQGNYALIAAEGLEQPSLSQLEHQDSRPWYLTVTGQRAVRIGFEVQAQDSVYQLEPKQPISTDKLQRLINPTFSSQAQDGNTLLNWNVRAGHSVDGAAIRLLKHARLLPAGIIVPLGQEIIADAIEINENDVYSGVTEQSESLRVVSQANIPLEDAEQAQVISFRPHDGSIEHLAIIVGKPDLNQPVLIRLHSECFTGDLLGSLRCDCGSQLRGAISLMAATEGGILLYLAQEGRGIGLVNKLRAYQLQDAGLDTVDANFDLGFDEDERDYSPAIQMLKHLNVRQVRLLTNNPRKVNALTRLGINVVERVAHVFPANRHNRGYLMTKGTRGGHLFSSAEYDNQD